MWIHTCSTCMIHPCRAMFGETEETHKHLPRWDTGRRVFPQQSLSLQEKPWLPFLEKTYGITDGHNYISWWQPSGFDFFFEISSYMLSRRVACEFRLPLKSPAPWAKGEGSILYAHLCILKHNAPWYRNFGTKTEKLSKHLEGLLLYMKERLSRIWLHWWMTPLDQYISCLGARLPSSSSCSSALTDT